jgi:hypothetical protein
MRHRCRNFGRMSAIVQAKGNKVVPFVAFTKLAGEAIKGTHDGARR